MQHDTRRFASCCCQELSEPALVGLADQECHADFKELGETDQVLQDRATLAVFPANDSALGHAKLFGQRRLAQSSLQAQLPQVRELAHCARHWLGGITAAIAWMRSTSSVGIVCR